MKILLDESVPQKLRLIIEGGHAVVTAWYQGWSGLKNGALLNAAEQAGVKAHIAGIMVAVEAATPGSYTDVKVPEHYVF